MSLIDNKLCLYRKAVRNRDFPEDTPDGDAGYIKAYHNTEYVFDNTRFNNLKEKDLLVRLRWRSSQGYIIVLGVPEVYAEDTEIDCGGDVTIYDTFQITDFLAKNRIPFVTWDDLNDKLELNYSKCKSLDEF